MAIAEKFKALADEWNAHCKSVRYSSILSDRVNHPAFRGMVELGPPAIPHIIERYRTDNLFWDLVLEQITGLQFGHDGGHYRRGEAQQAWIAWWDDKQAKRK